jgi:hypothetical protein
MLRSATQIQLPLAESPLIDEPSAQSSDLKHAFGQCDGDLRDRDALDIPKQPDRSVYSRAINRDGFFATSALSDRVIPSSQPTDYCISYNSSPPRISEKNQPPTFKKPNIPIDLATTSPIPPADDSVVPSSQSQSIIAFRVSPRKPENSRMSSYPTSVLASPSGSCSSTEDRIVQSSQSQLEGAGVFCGPSPGKHLARSRTTMPMSHVDPSNPISR